MSAAITARVHRLDVGLLDAIESQTSAADRRSLLALHGTMLTMLGTFRYLEIGSHLGGSLQALVAEPGCTHITSIDPRPRVQPDERPEIGYRWEYADNNTERMLAGLGAVPGADLGKIATIELSTEDIDPGSLPHRPDLCFIDGEHTNRAALRDARFCLAAVGDRGVIAFHDAWVTSAGIRRFLALAPEGTVGFTMPDGLFVADIGGLGLLDAPAIREAMTRARGGRLRLWVWKAANARRLRRRAVGLVLRMRYGPRAASVMRRLRAFKHRLG
jgi:hypothetical protein